MYISIQILYSEEILSLVTYWGSRLQHLLRGCSCEFLYLGCGNSASLAHFPHIGHHPGILALRQAQNGSLQQQMDILRIEHTYSITEPRPT